MSSASNIGAIKQANTPVADPGFELRGGGVDFVNGGGDRENHGKCQRIR